MPSISVTGRYIVFSSPTNFQLWYACHMPFERSLRVNSAIDSVCLYHMLSSNELRDFNLKCLMLWHCYTSMDSSQRALQTNGKLFPNLEIVFELMAENRKIFKLIAKSEYWSKYNVLQSMDSSWQALQTNGKLFFQISISFSKFWPKN